MFNDGISQKGSEGERLIDLLNRTGNKLPQVCYHPQLGPSETCDTCRVEINGQLVRVCATSVSLGGRDFSTQKTPRVVLLIQIFTWPYCTSSFDSYFNSVVFPSRRPRKLPTGARDSRFHVIFGAHEKDALSQR